jgi:hypothetical protein
MFCPEFVKLTWYKSQSQQAYRYLSVPWPFYALSIQRQNEPTCFLLAIILLCYIFYSTLVRMQINRLTHTRTSFCGIESYFQAIRWPWQLQHNQLSSRCCRKVNPLGTQQLRIHPREGYGYNNKEIDVDSVLRNQPEFKNNRCRYSPPG